MDDTYERVSQASTVHNDLNHLRHECIVSTAAATSAQRSSLSSKFIILPISDLKKLSRSPYCVFSNTRTGQTFSFSGEISQHVLSRWIISGWFRIEGWLKTATSEISARKVPLSSDTPTVNPSNTFERETHLKIDKQLPDFSCGTLAHSIQCWLPCNREYFDFPL
jgi:hypothetical protein